MCDTRAIPGRDSYSALRPVTCFSRILGIFPLSLKGPVGGRKYSTSCPWLTYTAVVFVLTITTLAIILSSERPEIFKRTSMARAATRSHEALQVISIIVVFATAVFAKEKFVNVINNTSAQDEALRKLGIRFDYAADFKQSCIRLGVIIPTILVFHIGDFVNVLEYNLRFPFIWFIFLFTRALRIISTCLIVEIVLVLKQKFTGINEALRKAIEETEDSPLQTIFLRYRICERIRLIARIHGNLCEYASNLNQIFGVKIVLGVILAFLTLTTTSYYLIREVQHPNGSAVRVLGCVIWLVLSCADIIYILWASSTTRTQAILTGRLVHKLNIPEADSALNTVIRNFSMQINHDKVLFTGAGFFPLDATLIRSICGAATTYVVIMIQFDTVTS